MNKLITLYTKHTNSERVLVNYYIFTGKVYLSSYYINSKKHYKQQLNLHPEHNKKAYTRAKELHPDYVKDMYKRQLELHSNLSKEAYKRQLELHSNHCREQYKRKKELHPDYLIEKRKTWHKRYEKYKESYLKNSAKRKRQLGFIKISNNIIQNKEIKINYHHINNLLVIPIPKSIHMSNYSKRGKHRELIDKHWISEFYPINNIIKSIL